VLAGLDLGRILLVLVAQLGDLLLAEQAVVGLISTTLASSSRKALYMAVMNFVADPTCGPSSPRPKAMRRA